MRLRRRLRLWWRYEHDKSGLILSTIAMCAAVLTGVYFAAQAVGSDAPASRPVVRPSPSPTPTEFSALWFGDSIVEGCCRSSDRAPNMAQVATRLLGWDRSSIHGFGGTGYITSVTVNGELRKPYPESIKPILANLSRQYDVVIIAGGNNDNRAGFDPIAFRSAVRSTLTQARAALPKAVMIVVGPYSPTGHGGEEIRAIERTEAARVRATFIDQIAEGWFRGKSALLFKDGFHPNDAGQAYLGQRLAADIRRLLPSVSRPPRP